MVGAAGAMKQAMAKAKPDAFVKIERVSKRFDDALAVDDVSLTINRGEIFALLGDPARASPPCCACSPASSGPAKAAYSSTVRT